MSLEDHSQLTKALAEWRRNKSLNLKDFSLVAAAPFVHELSDEERFDAIECYVQCNKTHPTLLNLHIRDISKYNEEFSRIASDLIKRRPDLQNRRFDDVVAVNVEGDKTVFNDVYGYGFDRAEEGYGFGNSITKEESYNPSSSVSDISISSAFNKNSFEQKRN